jgi:uncharacterized LabA/DUF88 family protein
MNSRTEHRFHIGQRVAVFVDVQNMFYGTYQVHNGRLKYGTLLEEVLRGRPLVSANAYVTITQDGKSQKFFSCLKDYGYNVKMKKDAEGVKNVGIWDVGMAVDVINLAMVSNKCDVVVIVTCEGNFVDAIDYVTRNGVMVEIYGFATFASHLVANKKSSFFEIPKSLIFDPGDSDADEYSEEEYEEATGDGNG